MKGLLLVVGSIYVNLKKKIVFALKELENYLLFRIEMSGIFGYLNDT